MLNVDSEDPELGYGRLPGKSSWSRDLACMQVQLTSQRSEMGMCDLTLLIRHAMEVLAASLTAELSNLDAVPVQPSHSGGGA